MPFTLGGPVEQQEQICTAVANVIRKTSQTGRLIQFAEIVRGLARRGLREFEADDPKSHLHAIIREVVQRNEDLREIPGDHGTFFYYSTQSLSEAYATILARREDDPVELIAEIVRGNSKIYPRPVPLDIFKEMPFDLSQAEIFECLEKMDEQAEYQDIAQTTTSLGTKYLFSTQHLDPHYASTLAEWLDVGQVNNP